jgi:hypothetical protein
MRKPIHVASAVGGCIPNALCPPPLFTRGHSHRRPFCASFSLRFSRHMMTPHSCVRVCFYQHSPRNPFSSCAPACACVLFNHVYVLQIPHNLQVGDPQPLHQLLQSTISTRSVWCMRGRSAPYMCSFAATLALPPHGRNSPDARAFLFHVCTPLYYSPPHNCACRNVVPHPNPPLIEFQIVRMPTKY